jgi:hypothetical protein
MGDELWSRRVRTSADERQLLVDITKWSTQRPRGAGTDGAARLSVNERGISAMSFDEDGRVPRSPERPERSSRVAAVSSGTHRGAQPHGHHGRHGCA